MLLYIDAGLYLMYNHKHCFIDLYEFHQKYKYKYIGTLFLEYHLFCVLYK